MEINKTLFQEIAKKPSPQCTCGECEIENQYYECDGCKRTVPWCYGGSDEYSDYCDCCYCELTKDDHWTITRTPAIRRYT